MQLVGEAGNGREAVEIFRKHHPDVTLMDLRMPEVDGIEATRLIRSEFPEARIIALTSYDGDQDIYRALEAGVRGYMLKEMVHTEVLHAIRIVHSGKRLMPPEVAERLSEILPASGAHAARGRSAEAGGAEAWRTKRSPRAGHRQRHHQDAHAEHPRQARRHRPHPRRDDRAQRGIIHL